MISLGVLLVFALVYAFFLGSVLVESKTYFTVILLCFVAFYDYIFIHLSYYINPGTLYIIKLWQEYLFLFLIFTFVFKLFFKKVVTFTKLDKKIFLLIVFLSGYAIFRGLVRSVSLIEVLLGWRMYMLPLLLMYLLYQAGILKQLSMRLFNKLVLCICLIVIAVAVYNDQTFQGNLTELYFYNFMDKLNPLDDHSFDFIRDNKLRATGVFVSPLIYSCFLAYSSLICMFYLILSSKNKVPLLILFLILIYGQYISRTRIGFIIFIVGVSTSLLAYWRPFVSIGKIIAIPLSLVTLTFLMLIFGYSEDASALGRLIQYAALPENFNMAGVGLGDELTAVKFDSWYISVVLLFGLITPLYLYLHFLLLREQHSFVPFVKLELDNIHEKVFFYAAYGYAFSFLYTFAFHFTIASATLQIFYLLLFSVIAKFTNRNIQSPEDSYEF